ncbi:hypothetical protein PUR32_11760, partial [Streptomyces sp. BE133]|nr:hypothetical protein [Streptomyces sp. BE133]
MARPSKYSAEFRSDAIALWRASAVRRTFKKQTPLVLSALEMGLWQRDRANTPVIARELIHHSDAGSQPGLNRLSQH